MSHTPARRGRQSSGDVARRRSGWLLPIAGLAALVLVLTLTFLNKRANPSGVTPISSLTTRDFHALLFSPADPNVVYFGHHDGLLMSDDQGTSWQPTSLQGADAMSLATSGISGQRIYAAGHGMLYRTDDAGKSWAPVTGALQGADIHAFAVSQEDEDRAYAFVVGQGVLTSDDGGAQWKPLPTTPSNDITALAAGPGQVVFLGDAAGIVYRSEDGGQSWQSGSLGSGMQVTGLAFDVQSGALYATAAMAGMNRGMVHRLAAPPSSWEPVPFTGSGIPLAIAVSPHDGQTLLVVNERGQVYRSRDGGATWRQ